MENLRKVIGKLQGKNFAVKIKEKLINENFTKVIFLLLIF
jgi:hypothetical protein